MSGLPQMYRGCFAVLVLCALCVCSLLACMAWLPGWLPTCLPANYLGSDIFSTFEELRAQVPEGVAASLSGIPWWTTVSAPSGQTVYSLFRATRRSSSFSPCSAEGGRGAEPPCAG
eukprot:SAG25_NODE_76_length_16934_cov_51.463202_4_plen_116_part_00